MVQVNNIWPVKKKRKNSDLCMEKIHVEKIEWERKCTYIRAFEKVLEVSAN